jgi:ABC-type sulfate/molybdate transport systems ATPase subunit
VPRPERIDAASAALSLLGAGHLADRQADSLSGGERRRVHLARAIAVRPDILMFDEPFAGVDVETRSALLEDSLSAIRSSARATLVVVHDRAEAWAMADRLLILLDGRLVASGAPERLLECPPTSAVARFLGFDGMLEDGEGVLLTRPRHVVIDPDGPLDARVVGAIPLEDGVRLALALDRGMVYAVAGRPAPSPGERVRLRLLGGVRFPGR